MMFCSAPPFKRIHLSRFPVDEDDVITCRRAKKSPFNKYGVFLIASKRRLTRHAKKLLDVSFLTGRAGAQADLRSPAPNPLSKAAPKLGDEKAKVYVGATCLYQTRPPRAMRTIGRVGERAVIEDEPSFITLNIRSRANEARGRNPFCSRDVFGVEAFDGDVSLGLFPDREAAMSTFFDRRDRKFQSNGGDPPNEG